MGGGGGGGGRGRGVYDLLLFGVCLGGGEGVLMIKKNLQQYTNSFSFARITKPIPIACRRIYCRLCQAVSNYFVKNRL